jgi:hypothetical protein
MPTIDIFYQGEGLRDIEHIEVGPEQTFNALKELLIEKHALEKDVIIFIEDSDEPVDENKLVREHSGHAGVKVHLHRCKHIEVAVTFNAEIVHHRFGPGTTVARVKRWAAEDKFKMSKEEASEHVLQISGTHDRPAPGTHLGALTSRPSCRVAFDLVPDQRVNGASSGELS